MTATKIMKRVLLYILIALGFLAACSLFVAVSIYTGHTHGLPVGWFGLVGFTPLVFWAVIKSLRNHWKRRGFWFAVSALLVVHLLAFVGILLRYPQWPLLWFIPVSFAEAGLFVIVLGKLFNGGDRSAV
jgi:hypothetical protein